MINANSDLVLNTQTNFLSNNETRILSASALGTPGFFGVWADSRIKHTTLNYFLVAKNAAVLSAFSDFNIQGASPAPTVGLDFAMTPAQSASFVGTDMLGGVPSPTLLTPAVAFKASPYLLNFRTKALICTQWFSNVWNVSGALGTPGTLVTNFSMQSFNLHTVLNTMISAVGSVNITGAASATLTGATAAIIGGGHSVTVGPGGIVFT